MRPREPELKGHDRIGRFLCRPLDPVTVCGALSVPGVLLCLTHIPEAWIATLVIASTSFFFLEQPLLRLKRHFRAP